MHNNINYGAEMKFIIKRTSIWDQESPCEEARRETYTRIDERIVDDPKKIHFGNVAQTWYKQGENHRVENGHIKRDFPGEREWFIEINNLDDLLKLKSKYGDLVLGEHCSSDFPSIEIYDDYRE